MIITEGGAQLCPRRPTARSDRVGNTPVPPRHLFDVVARARCPPSKVAALSRDLILVVTKRRDDGAKLCDRGALDLKRPWRIRSGAKAKRSQAPDIAKNIRRAEGAARRRG